MPLFSNLICEIEEICSRFKGSNSNLSPKPKNFVRLCRRRGEFEKIIIEAIYSHDQDWEDDLIDRVVKYILDEETQGISVYNSKTADPFDRVHSLAVVAEGMSQNDFRSHKTKRKSGSTRGSLIIPVNSLPEIVSYEFTPENNLNFYPANNYHFDLAISDSHEFAKFLLTGISQGTITFSLLGSGKKDMASYRLQAGIAYSYCLKSFGKLDPNTPPCGWTDGQQIDASEQINTLMHLAGTSKMQSVEKPK